jgi:hypothetical protein
MLKGMALILTTLATALPMAAQNDTTLPDGPGKAIVQRMCVGCHKVKVIASKHATKDQWSTIVQQMVSRGADGTDEEIDIVVDYLATHYPPLKTAPPPASCSLLDQRIPPNVLSYASLLTASRANLEEMLHYRQSFADTPRSIRLQRKAKRPKDSASADISSTFGGRQLLQAASYLPELRSKAVGVGTAQR